MAEKIPNGTDIKRAPITIIIVLTIEGMNETFSEL
jgi:hypothetical protein